MKAIVLVARREIRVQAKSKGFIFGLVLSALVVAGIVAGPKVFGGDDAFEVGLAGTRSAPLRPALAAPGTGVEAAVKVTPYRDEAAARKAVIDGDVDVAIVDGRVTLTDGEPDSELEALVQGAHRAVESSRRLAASGIDARQVESAMRVEPLSRRSVTGETRYEDARRGLAMMIVVALFVLLITSAMTVAMGVVEEKSSRIVEILLIAVRPWQLLGGKIIAMGVLGLTQLVVFAGSGLGTAAAVDALPDLPPGTPGIIVGAFAGYLLGYAFFAAMAAALGSLISRQEELSGVLSPMTMLMMGAYGVAFWAAADPRAPVAEVLSLVPPFSCMVMPVRAAATDVPVWQVGLAAVLMMGAAALMLMVGGRVYERAVLCTGAKVRLAEVLRVPADNLAR